MYDDLKTLSTHFLGIKNSFYKRYLIRTVQFTHQLTIIIGQRGVGKTTTLIQTLLDYVNGDRFSNKILYIQADHFLMGSTTLYDIASQFHMLGGEWIAFDEVHKYADWSQELKSIHDTFPKLKVLASGSSALEISKGSHDLSRRALVYKMQGLSFREYLELKHGFEFNVFSLDQICKKHDRISAEIIEKIEDQDLKVIPEFHDYLKSGYFPYFLDCDPISYMLILEQNLHATLDSDLAVIYQNLSANSINKIRKLLIFIANIVPFTPGWDDLIKALEIGDVRTLRSYFNHLEDAELIRVLSKSKDKLSHLKTSDKIYLDNTNQLYAICGSEPEKGTIRETFFLTTLSQKHKLSLPGNGDFCVDNELIFEVGGRNKKFEQVKSEKNAFLACDNIEHGYGAKIPLWLFGFLY